MISSQNCRLQILLGLKRLHFYLKLFDLLYTDPLTMNMDGPVLLCIFGIKIRTNVANYFSFFFTITG